MNKVIVFVSFFLIIVNSAIGQNESEYRQLIKNAVDAYDIQDYKTSVKYFQEAFKINNTNPNDLFNGACSAALDGDTLTAFRLLNLSADNGYKDIEHIKKDTDLHSLRNLYSWGKILIRVKENKENYLSSDKILKSIFESIQNNNFDKIWNYVSDNLKETQNKDSIKINIDKLYSILKKYNLNFNDLSNKQLGTSTYNYYSSNGKTTESKKYNYYITPKILGKSTQDYFQKNIGYEIYIELTNQANKWTLNRITLNDKYLSKNFNHDDLLNNFFNDSATITCQMGVITKNKELACLSSYKGSEISFKDSFNSLSWEEFKDIPIVGDTIIYKMYFVKKTNTPKNNSTNAFDSFFRSNVTYKFIEIVFADNTDYIIISNGDMYGIYKGEITKIKKWIMDEFKKL